MRNLFLAHCAVFLFYLYMDFVRELEPWSAAHIAETLGCPERTIYAWKKGERLPPEWAQRLVIARLKRTRPTRRYSQRA